MHSSHFSPKWNLHLWIGNYPSSQEEVS